MGLNEWYQVSKTETDTKLACACEESLRGAMAARIPSFDLYDEIAPESEEHEVQEEEEEEWSRRQRGSRFIGGWHVIPSRALFSTVFAPQRRRSERVVLW
eukprot:s2618_g8.t1